MPFYAFLVSSCGELCIKGCIGDVYMLVVLVVYSQSSIFDFNLLDFRLDRDTVTRRHSPGWPHDWEMLGCWD